MVMFMLGDGLEWNKDKKDRPAKSRDMFHYFFLSKKFAESLAYRNARVMSKNV